MLVLVYEIEMIKNLLDASEMYVIRVSNWKALQTWSMLIAQTSKVVWIQYIERDITNL